MGEGGTEEEEKFASQRLCIVFYTLKLYEFIYFFSFQVQYLWSIPGILGVIIKGPSLHVSILQFVS